jgi:hypothetical protein
MAGAWVGGRTDTPTGAVEIDRVPDSSAALFQPGVIAAGVGLAATRHAERAVAIVRSIAPGR